MIVIIASAILVTVILIIAIVLCIKRMRNREQQASLQKHFLIYFIVIIPNYRNLNLKIDTDTKWFNQYCYISALIYITWALFIIVIISFIICRTMNKYIYEVHNV